MLIQDGMNAIIVKGDYWYQVHRISDPEKDGIYNNTLQKSISFFFCVFPAYRLYLHIGMDSLAALLFPMYIGIKYIEYPIPKKMVFIMNCDRIKQRI